MTRMVLFVTEQGDGVWINPDTVSAVRQHRDDPLRTSVVAAGETIWVHGPAGEIVEDLIGGPASDAHEGFAHECYREISRRVQALPVSDSGDRYRQTLDDAMLAVRQVLVEGEGRPGDVGEKQ